MSAKEYRRLPGRGLRRIGPVAFWRTTNRLWLGSDHLLSSDSTGYTEEYRRFYFRDLQAIILRRTDRGRNWTAGLAFLTICFALAGYALGPVGAAVLWSLAALLLLSLAINAARGPTCTCHLQTAVQFEELPALGRVRAARKALAQLRAVIEETQGVLSGEEVARRLQDQVPTMGAQDQPAPVRVIRSATLPGGVSAPTNPYTGHFHTWLFGLLLLTSAWTVLDFFARHVAMVWTGALIGLGSALAVILALVRQSRSAVSRRVQSLTWVTLAFIIVNTIIGYAVFIGIVISNHGQVPDQLEYIRMIAELPLTSPWLRAAIAFSGMGSLLLGALGLFWLAADRRGLQRAAAAQSDSEFTKTAS